jgi:hypothetical protein
MFVYLIAEPAGEITKIFPEFAVSGNHLEIFILHRQIAGHRIEELLEW